MGASGQAHRCCSSAGASTVDEAVEAGEVVVAEVEEHGFELFPEDNSVVAADPAAPLGLVVDADRGGEAWGADWAVPAGLRGGCAGCSAAGKVEPFDRLPFHGDLQLPDHHRAVFVADQASDQVGVGWVVTVCAGLGWTDTLRVAGLGFLVEDTECYAAQLGRTACPFRGRAPAYQP